MNLKNFRQKHENVLAAAFVAIVISIASAYLYLPNEIKHLTKDTVRIENRIDNINTRLDDLSQQISYVKGKLDGIDTSSFMRISTDKGNTKQESHYNLGRLTNQTTFEAKIRFLEENDFTPAEIKSILLPPNGKPKNDKK